MKDKSTNPNLTTNPRNHSSLQTTNGLKVMFTNIDVLSNKLIELESYINDHQPHVICLNEMLPKSCKNISDVLSFEIPNYKKYTTSTDGQMNRGTATFIHETIESEQCVFLNSQPPTDTVWCHVKLKKDTLLLGNVYRSPNNSPEDNNILNTFISTACDQNRNKNVLIVGDFNCKDISWSNMTTPQNSSHHCSKLIETLKENYLHQLVDQFTRQRGNDQPSLLDLVLTNSPDIVTSISFDPPLGKSDHCVLLVQVNMVFNVNPCPDNMTYNFYRGDYTSITDALNSINWKEEFQCKTVSQSWTYLKNQLHMLMHKHIPKKTSKLDKKNPPWLSKAAREAIKRKKKAWNKYKSQQTTWSAQRYRHIRNQCCLELRNIKYKFEQKIASESKSQPKSSWNYVNSRSMSSSYIPDLTNPDGNLTSNDHDKAQVLNSYFSSVFTNEYMTTTIHQIYSLQKQTFHHCQTYKPLNRKFINSSPN